MGGGGPSSSTSYQTNLPEYARPYYEGLMNRAEDVSEQPYIPYGGQRLYNEAPATQQAYGMTGNLANSPMTALNTGANMANQAGQGALGLGSLPQYMINGTPGVSPQGSVSSGLFNQNVADFYSSPYMQNVIERGQQGMRQTFDEGRAARNTAAVNAGAFGGSRRHVQEAIAERGLEDRMADFEAQGLQAMYENAQQQYERDRAARQGAQRFNIESRMQGDLANQQAFLTQEQANQQASQFGQNLGLQGYQTGLQAGATLGDLQATGDQLTLDRIKAMMATGQGQEEYQQAGLDLAYNDFINQRDAERQNLQFYSSLLRGVPISANQNVTTYEGSNPMAAVGALGGLASLYS